MAFRKVILQGFVVAFTVISVSYEAFAIPSLYLNFNESPEVYRLAARAITDDEAQKYGQEYPIFDQNGGKINYSLSVRFLSEGEYHVYLFFPGETRPKYILEISQNPKFPHTADVFGVAHLGPNVMVAGEIIKNAVPLKSLEPKCVPSISNVINFPKRGK